MWSFREVLVRIKSQLELTKIIPHVLLVMFTFGLIFSSRILFVLFMFGPKSSSDSLRKGVKFPRAFDRFVCLLSELHAHLMLILASFFWTTILCWLCWKGFVVFSNNPNNFAATNSLNLLILYIRILYSNLLQFCKLSKRLQLKFLREIEFSISFYFFSNFFEFNA